MHYLIKRFGLKPTRGWVSLFIVISVLVAGGLWVGPFNPGQPQLRLVALSGDGRFDEAATIPASWAQPLSPASEATARIPVILAVHNAGVRAAQPERVALSVPARFRVTDARGMPYPARATIGNPLVRYDFAINTPPVQPGRLPTVLGGLDTLWLEPVVPSIYCTALSDSVPEFVSAPPQNAELLSNVRVFYSFTGAGIKQRQAGLLSIQVDAELVRREPARAPPIFPTQVVRPEAPRPLLGELRQVGTRNTWCGDPGRPLELFDVLWETPEGGRFFVLHHGGVPRKYLFDLNRDSIIELEMWDQDGDGKFESRRPARYAIPAFLMPYPELPELAAADSALLPAGMDTTATDAAWAYLFHDTAAGPLRFSGVRRAPDAAAAQPPVAAAPGAAQPATPIAVPPAMEADPGWLRTFNNTSAGPLRFYRALLGEPPPAPPARRRDTGPRLLGVPVEEFRQQQQQRPRTDTLRNDLEPVR